MTKNPSLVDQELAGLFIIDMQTKLLNVMEERDQVIQAVQKLIKGFQIVGRPIFYTEQYPEGLGPTESSLRELLGDVEPVIKEHFSACRLPDTINKIWGSTARQLVVVGVEAHICVLQTALDLVAEGFQVFVVYEGISSRKSLDRDIAVKRMANSRVEIVTVESVLFELLTKAGTKEFRQIQKLIK